MAHLFCRPQASAPDATAHRTSLVKPTSMMAPTGIRRASCVMRDYICSPPSRHAAYCSVGSSCARPRACVDRAMLAVVCVVWVDGVCVALRDAAFAASVQQCAL